MNFGLPKKILVMYTDYTEERSVDERGNILAGRCVSRDGMHELVKEIFEQQLQENEDQFKSKTAYHLLSSYVPSNVVFVQTSYVSHKFIFKTEARQQTLLFHDRLQSMASAKYAIPNLIWLCTEDDLMLFAYTEWKELETELYYAPFANMNSHVVCLGADLPEKRDDLVSYFKEIQDGFWNTNFTHTTSNKVIKGNFANSWKTMINKKKFNNALLLPAKLKLQDLCN